MQTRVGKVVDSADVIVVVMGEHDVGDIGRVIAECLHLAHRCLRFGEPRVKQKLEGTADPGHRIGDIAQAESGVDKQQPRSGVDEQTMANQPAALPGCSRAFHEPFPDGRHRATVQVMNAHGQSSVPESFASASISTSSPGGSPPKRVVRAG